MAMSRTLSAMVSCGRRTRPAITPSIQVDTDGGGDFVTIAILNGAISNNVLANQTILIDDSVA